MRPQPLWGDTAVAKLFMGLRLGRKEGPTWPARVAGRGGAKPLFVQQACLSLLESRSLVLL